MRKKEIKYQVSQKSRIILWLVLNFALCIAVESINALYIQDRLIYLMHHLDIFLINYIILLTLTCPAIPFNKMPFVFSIFSIFIMGLAHTSKILMIIRGLPLTWPDFFILKEGLSIADKYLSGDIIILIIILVGIALVLLRQSYTYKLMGIWDKRLVLFLLVMTSTNVGIVAYVQQEDEEVSVQSSINFSEEGTVYSFVTSYKGDLDKVIKAYNQEAIGVIQKKVLSKASQEEKPIYPNIIFLQTESFIDPYSLKDITYNKDPVPYMRPYLNSKWSGHMEVPDVNTARTEFEVLTGIRIENLFQYQVPYTSDLLDGRAIESLAQVLREKDYHTTAIHNNKADFYERDKIYGLLGFEHFIALEDMKKIEYSKNWPKDKVLFKYIKETLEATSNTDLVYTVTVGTHSSYDGEYANPESIIKVGGKVSAETLNQVQDYVDRLYETDLFIGELIQYIKESKEPTVLVVYGDHIPALEAITYDEEYIKNQVPYFITSNFELQGSAEPITTSYKLYAQVFNLLNIKEGIMPTLHNTLSLDEDYYNALDLMAYDMLLGEYYVAGGKAPYQKITLQRGIPKKD